MNERIKELAINSNAATMLFNQDGHYYIVKPELEKFAELLHRQVIASILITDVVMEAKGQVPTSEDYIRAINKDFGVEE